MSSHALQTRRSQAPGHSHNCRCDTQCKPLKNAWERNRHRHLAYGDWQPFVDIEPTRQHIRTLMAAGATMRRIATATGYDHGYLGRVLWGPGGKPWKRISPEIAETILATTLDRVGISDNTHVDPTGTLRRLRALHATGRPTARIGRDLGRGPATIQKIINEQAPVTAAFAALVADRYPQLKDRQPEDDGVSRRNARESRTRAAALDWKPPAAWDDDIDDPRAIANTMSSTRAKANRVPRVEFEARRSEQVQRAKELHAQGHNCERVGQLIGVAGRTVYRWQKAGWPVAA